MALACRPVRARLSLAQACGRSPTTLSDGVAAAFVEEGLRLGCGDTAGAMERGSLATTIASSARPLLGGPAVQELQWRGIVTMSWLQRCMEKRGSMPGLLSRPSLRHIVLAVSHAGSPSMIAHCIALEGGVQCGNCWAATWPTAGVSAAHKAFGGCCVASGGRCSAVVGSCMFGSIAAYCDHSAMCGGRLWILAGPKDAPGLSATLPDLVCNQSHC